MEGDRPDIRLDKWLWYARFFKTRSLAAKQVSGGHVRVNATRVVKPAHAVGPDDVLTFPQGRNVRVVKILAVGNRRGPAPEAQALYEDLSPPQVRSPEPDGSPKSGAAPSKRERRDAAKLSRFDLE